MTAGAEGGAGPGLPGADGSQAVLAAAASWEIVAPLLDPVVVTGLRAQLAVPRRAHSTPEAGAEACRRAAELFRGALRSGGGARPVLDVPAPPLGYTGEDLAVLLWDVIGWSVRCSVLYGTGCWGFRLWGGGISLGWCPG
ncbi:hypothetical protein ACFWPV_27620 [Streptomyces uncialis]|uniref:hypothetical protein n=1 Tax=Streptomyces uncialis TaxID=1048205 RepID=UPI003652C708